MEMVGVEILRPDERMSPAISGEVVGEVSAQWGGAASGSAVASQRTFASVILLFQIEVCYKTWANTPM